MHTKFYWVTVMNSQFFGGIFSKEMTRKEFLTHAGLMILVITGVAGVLKTLSEPDVLNFRTKASKGFGAGPYGGVKKG